MNTQEIFDTVAEHLLTQKEKSENDCGDLCLYRGPNGMKCAAGVLIPDEEYTESMEGNTINVVEYFRENFSGTELDLIDNLQEIHDLFSVDQWRGKLGKLAIDWGINPSVLG